MSALLALLKQKKQDLAAGNRRKTIKPTAGTSRFRILPSWRGVGEAQFYHDFGQHFVKDGSGKLLAVYMCTDKTYGKPCGVCDAIRQGTASASDDFTMKQLKEASASGRVLVNALHIDGPTPGEVQILELAPTAFAALVNIACEWEEAGESILDLAKGKDILVTRTGEGILTKYTMQVAAKSNPVGAEIVAKLHNLDEYVNQESSEQQMRALNAVRSVSGLLAAPAAVAGAPRLPAAAAGAATIDEDPYAAAAPPPKRVAPAAVVEDVVAKPVAARPAAAPAAPAADTGDAELDELLNQLGK